MTGLTPGSQITRLRELDHAGYVRTEKTGDDRAQTTVALTVRWPGRAGSLHRRAAAAAPGGQERHRHQHLTCALAMLTGTRRPWPWVERFAQGRLTLDELDGATTRRHVPLLYARRPGPGRPGSARPDGAVGPGGLLPEKPAGRGTARPGSPPEDVAAPSRLGRRRVIMSQDGLEPERDHVSRRGATAAGGGTGWTRRLSSAPGGDYAVLAPRGRLYSFR